MALPKFLQTYLASYDLSKLGLQRDKNLIITEILNKGDDQAMRWLGEKYSQKDIKKVVSSPTRGMWMKSVLDHWIKVFNLKIPKLTYEVALFNLNPRPKLMEKFFLEQEKKNKKYHKQLKELGLNAF